MEGTARPDYRRCVEISTAASISEMIPPGILVMGTPLIVGTLFGVRTLAGGDPSASPRGWASRRPGYRASRTLSMAPSSSLLWALPSAGFLPPGAASLRHGRPVF